MDTFPATVVIHRSPLWSFVRSPSRVRVMVGGGLAPPPAPLIRAVCTECVQRPAPLPSSPKEARRSARVTSSVGGKRRTDPHSERG